MVRRNGRSEFLSMSVHQTTTLGESTSVNHVHSAPDMVTVPMAGKVTNVEKFYLYEGNWTSKESEFES
jgi:hypothetical protein